MAGENDDTQKDEPEPDQPKGAQEEPEVGPIRKWWRVAVIAIVIILLSLVNSTYAAEVAGATIGLGIFWFIIKGFRPSWTSGWSGAWLFIVGVIAAIFVPVPTTGSSIGWGMGFGIATVIVLPSMIGWKVWERAKG